MRNTANLTANGTAGPWTVSGDIWVSARGTFGSGTVSIQIDFGSGYAEEFSLAAAGQQLIELPLGRQASVRAVLSGATAPDLDIDVVTETA